MMFPVSYLVYSVNCLVCKPNQLRDSLVLDLWLTVTALVLKLGPDY